MLILYVCIKAESLVEDIRSVFVNMLGKVAWMDSRSRRTAQEKVSAGLVIDIFIL